MAKVFQSIKGLTFIESLIIICIIGAISITAFFYFDPIGKIKKANDIRRKSDLLLIQQGLQKYYRDFGKFPPNPGNCAQDAKNCKIVGLDANNPISDWGKPFQPYIDVLPKDPRGKTYIYFSTGQAYYLYASLDIGDDPQVCSNENACTSLITNGINSRACGGICNYAVTSSNVSP